MAIYAEQHRNDSWVAISLGAFHNVMYCIYGVVAGEAHVVNGGASVSQFRLWWFDYASSFLPFSISFAMCMSDAANSSEGFSSTSHLNKKSRIAPGENADFA